MRAAKPNWGRHILLFVLTAVSTTVVFNFTYASTSLPNGTLVALRPGLSYAFWLLLILSFHEAGHYVAAKRHRVAATLPFFIPLPLPPLGTMGAVIRMSPYIPNRRALFDIAAAGPLAGIVVAIPVTYWAMLSAQRVLAPKTTAVWGFAEPLLFQAIETVAIGPRPEGYDIALTPMLFAGWVGMFVTALNLLPISQLDGGHVAYALFGKNSRWIAFAVFGGLVLVMMTYGWQYILLLALVWFAGLTHPPTLDDAIPLDRNRQVLGALILVIFIICFTPQPIVSVPQ